jgi:hypothetical protein
MNTFGAHFIETQRAQAICEAAARGVGLSAQANWRAQQAFLNPYDTEGDQRGYAFGYPRHDPPIPPQICCLLTLCAALRDAGKDGTLDWGGYSCDVLRVPQAGVPGVSPRLVGDSPRILRALAEKHGLLREPVPDERPNLDAGTALLIGGDDGLPPAQRIYGGPAHGLLVVGVRDDGLLDTIEGGQGDGTAILQLVRELHQVGRTWWVRAAGAAGKGRMLRWWFAAGELPDKGDA